MLIATHNGGFHADDVLGVAMIRLLHGADLPVVRTRDPDVIARADFVVDVGARHEPELGRFDHHQRGGAGAREDSGVPYASAGLVWRALGERIVERLTGTPEGAAEIAARLDAGLITAVDAVDCGVEGFYKGPAGVSTLIGCFNPDWREERPDFDAAFHEALGFAATTLRNAVRDAHAAVAARAVVAAAARHEDGRVVELARSCPWQEHLLELHPDAVFVVFPDDDGRWRLRDVPIGPGTFVSRKRLPKAWGGLEGAALDAATGIPGGVFCHTGLFTAGHRERTGVLAMARLALEAA